MVDANLRVYGLANVRVADASVPPIALSTHLMASTYGVAELASGIIREYWNVPSSRTSACASASSPVATAESTSTGVHSAKSHEKSLGSGLASLLPRWTAIAAVGLNIFFVLNGFV